MEKADIIKYLPYMLILQVYFYLFFHSAFNVFQQNIANHGWLYFIEFYFPKFIPLLLFAVYLLTKREHTLLKWFYTKTAWAFFIIGVAFTTVMFALSCASASPIMDISLNGAYEWSWPALLTWAFIYLASYLLCTRKTGDAAFSFTFSALLISAAGMFYELPIYLRMEWGFYLHSSHPYILAVDFFSMAFLIYLAYTQKWRLNKTLIFTFAIYVIHGVLWHFNPALFASINLLNLGMWLPRVLGSLPLLALTTGFTVSPPPPKKNYAKIRNGKG